MREKLIELLRAVQYQGNAVHGYHDNYIQNSELADHLIANGVTIQKWIPVTERLPESKTQILVYGGKIELWVNGVKQQIPSIFIGYMRGLDEGWFTWDSSYYISDVTHWMPMPEPPKGG